jgi:hypothetical protein
VIRGDISDRLIHLTRDFEDKTAKQRFHDILSSQRLKGGNTDVRGPFKCICFSETPISSIAQLIARQSKEMRYSSYGFMFAKEYLFGLGARPVIYEPEKEYHLLPDEIKYRHVRFELSSNKITDLTWEREWRLKSDELILDTLKTTVIVPTRQILRDVIANEQATIRQAGLSRIFGAFPQTDWHFIALEDLGFKLE